MKPLYDNGWRQRLEKYFSFKRERRPQAQRISYGWERGSGARRGASAASCHQGKELHRGTVGLRPDGSRGLSSSTAELADLSITEGMQTRASGQLVINIINELPESSRRSTFPFWLVFSSPALPRLPQASAVTHRFHPPLLTPSGARCRAGPRHGCLHLAKFGMCRDRSTCFPSRTRVGFSALAAEQTLARGLKPLG